MQKIYDLCKCGVPEDWFTEARNIINVTCTTAYNKCFTTQLKLYQTQMKLHMQTSWVSGLKDTLQIFNLEWKGNIACNCTVRFPKSENDKQASNPRQCNSVGCWLWCVRRLSRVNSENLTRNSERPADRGRRQVEGEDRQGIRTIITHCRWIYYHLKR